MTEEGIDFLDSRIPDILSSIDRARIELVFDTRNYLETGGRRGGGRINPFATRVVIVGETFAKGKVYLLDETSETRTGQRMITNVTNNARIITIRS